MKDLPPPHDLMEAMGETYELFLEKVAAEIASKWRHGPSNDR